MVTLKPRSLSSRPRLEAVRPLPRLEATPPVTKRCRVLPVLAATMKLPWCKELGKAAGPRDTRITGRRQRTRYWRAHAQPRRQVAHLRPDAPPRTGPAGARTRRPG